MPGISPSVFLPKITNPVRPAKFSRAGKCVCRGVVIMKITLDVRLAQNFTALANIAVGVLVSYR